MKNRKRRGKGTIKSGRKMRKRVRERSKPSKGSKLGIGQESKVRVTDWQEVWKTFTL